MTDDTCKPQDQERNSNVVPHVEKLTITEKLAPEILDSKSTCGLASDTSDEKSEKG